MSTAVVSVPLSVPTRRTPVRSRSRHVVRLTRRGRVVLLLTVMALLVAAGLTLGHGSSQASVGARVAPRTLTVQPGDTLWSVARRIAPQQDPRLVIAALESLNRLPGDQVVAGQRLLLPSMS